MGWEVRILLSPPSVEFSQMLGTAKRDVPQGRVLQRLMRSTKLSSRPGFPPAFPPHSALDPGSEIPMK